MATKALWDQFCTSHAVAANSVPLFSTDSFGRVDVIYSGEPQKPYLKRSGEMENMVGSVVGEVLSRSPSEIEGLLYMMLRLDDQGGVIPLYVGRAGRHGKNGTLVSANLKGIRQTLDGSRWTNGHKFARWGYGYAYHIGDLSCATLPGHEPNKPKPKYCRWAQQMFKDVPSPSPQLRFDVRFWCAPWGPASYGIWQEFGPCPLAFIEYLLIGVASLLFPNDLLNEEGVNRQVTHAMSEES